MHFKLIIVAGLLIAPVSPTAQAQTFVASAGSGCQVSVDAVPGDTIYRWQGACKEGKAEGQGLLTSSLGGMLRGEFKSGQPYNAHGFWPLKFNSGNTVMTQMNVTEGMSKQDSINFPDAQGQPSPISSAPLAGEWTFTTDDGKCIEQHTYNVDGTAEIKGGEEVMQSSYGLMQVAGNKQVFGFVKTNIASNGKKDCTGHVSRVERGDTRFTYLYQEGPDKFVTCSVSGKPLRCFGRLERRARRVLAQP